MKDNKKDAPHCYEGIFSFLPGRGLASACLYQNDDHCRKCPQGSLDMIAGLMDHLELCNYQPRRMHRHYGHWNV